MSAGYPSLSNRSLLLISTCKAFVSWKSQPALRKNSGSQAGAFQQTASLASSGLPSGHRVLTTVGGLNKDHKLDCFIRAFSQEWLSPPLTLGLWSGRWEDSLQIWCQLVLHHGYSPWRVIFAGHFCRSFLLDWGNFSFVLLMQWITVLDFHMSNQLCIPG